MRQESTNHPSREQLSAFVAGKLAGADQAEVESHVAQCAPCCDVLRSLPQETIVQHMRPSDTSCSPAETEAGLSSVLSDLGYNDAGPPTELADHPRYRIVRQLGAGGMGVVYEAQHRLMERTVALKVINRPLVNNTQAIERFHLEVRAAARLSHRNIVAAYDAEQAGDVHFLVMEFVEGDSLSQLVERRGKLSVLHACNFAMQAAQGLQHALERGMVHRDIKPQNLMRTPKGTIKILDFGLARLSGEMESERLTKVGATIGTADYIAPEQVEDSRHVDIRADIYSLGCTLYFLLAGHAPFPDRSVVDKMLAHLQLMPRPLPELRDDIPPEVLRILERMIAKDPAQRFQTPAEVVEALKPFGRPDSKQDEPVVSDADDPDAPPGVTEQPAPASTAAPPLEHEDPFAIPFLDLETPQGRLITSPARRRRPDKPLMLIGLGAGVLVLLLVVGLLVQSMARDGVVDRERENDTRQTVESGGRRAAITPAPRADGPRVSPPESPLARPTAAPTAPASPITENPAAAPLPEAPSSLAPVTANATELRSDDWIDLLVLVDPASGAVEGQWRKQDGALLVDATPSARLMLPYRPPAQYDFEVSFTRDTGVHSVALFFVAGAGQATFEIDAWGQNLAGIQNIDGQTLTSNTASVGGRVLQNGTTYTARVEVRRGRVAVYLDDEMLASYEGDGANLSVHDLWELPELKTLGLGAYECATTFHRIRVRHIDSP